MVDCRTRIKALPYFLIQANQTNRMLLIHWNKRSIDLEEFWMPPPGGMDWSVPRDHSIFSRLFYDDALDANSCLVKLQAKHRVQVGGSKPILGGATGGSQIACSCHQMYSFERSKDDMEQYRTAQHKNSYGYAFRTMFQPSPGFGSYLERTLRGPDLGLQLDTVRYTTKDPYLAVHIRSRYPLPWKRGTLVRPTMEKNPDLVTYFADRAVDSIITKYVERHYPPTQFPTDINDIHIPPVYVASDSSDVVRYLKFISTQYGVMNNCNSTIIPEASLRSAIIEGRKVRVPRVLGQETLVRPHIEFINIVSNSDEKEGPQDVTGPSDLYPVFLDLWMLSASRCIAYGIGGYGRLGFFLGMQSDCHVQYMQKTWYSKVDKASKEYYQSKQLPLPSSFMAANYSATT